jgi:hypothetical protein
MLSVLANRTYRHLFAAQVLALIGTGMMIVALGLLAFRIAGDKAGAVLGRALAIKMIAYVGVAPVVGGFASFLPRRAFLVSMDITRAAVALALPFVDQVWQVYVLIFVLQSASAAFNRSEGNIGVRHGRTCSGHPRLERKKDVDARDKPGHDEFKWGSSRRSLILRSRALARPLEGWLHAQTRGHPSRRGQKAAPQDEVCAGPRRVDRQTPVFHQFRESRACSLRSTPGSSSSLDRTRAARFAADCKWM